MSKRNPVDERFLRVLKIALVACYFGGVAMVTILKITTSNPTPWAEVIYGPAITVVSCVAMAVGINWIVNRFGDRSN